MTLAMISKFIKQLVVLYNSFILLKLSLAGAGEVIIFTIYHMYCCGERSLLQWPLQYCVLVHQASGSEWSHHCVLVHQASGSEWSHYCVLVHQASGSECSPPGFRQ